MMTERDMHTHQAWFYKPVAKRILKLSLFHLPDQRQPFIAHKNSNVVGRKLLTPPSFASGQLL
jgi:hypothetical protein